MFVKIVQVGTILCLLTLPFEGAASRYSAVEKQDVADSFHEENIRYRLPNGTKPETYDLSLRTGISMGEFDYDGLMIINILVLNATRELTLHSKGLRITSVRMSDTNGTGVIALLPWRTNNATDFLIIPTKSAELLAGNRYRLDIKFAGELQRGSRGFYRTLSNPANPNGR